MTCEYIHTHMYVHSGVMNSLIACAAVLDTRDTICWYMHTRINMVVAWLVSCHVHPSLLWLKGIVFQSKNLGKKISCFQSFVHVKNPMFLNTSIMYKNPSFLHYKYSNKNPLKLPQATLSMSFCLCICIAKRIIFVRNRGINLHWVFDMDKGFKNETFLKNVLLWKNRGYLLSKYL